MVPMRILLVGICVLVTIPSAHSKLTMHQQHLKMHQEMLKKKQQATGKAGATKTDGTASGTPKPATSASVPPVPARQPPDENRAQSLPEANRPSRVPDRESQQSGKAASQGHAEEAPKSGGTPRRYQAAGHSAPKEVPMEQGDTSRDADRESSGQPSPAKSPDSVGESRGGHSQDTDSSPKDKIASQGDDGERQEGLRIVSDDDLIFIDEGVGKEEEVDQDGVRRYPDPDLDKEDGGTGDFEGRGDGGVTKEEEGEDEEEDYHPDDYIDNRQQEGSEGTAKPREDGDMVSSLAYTDFENVLFEEKFNMLHFVSADCKDCERFRPQFREAALRLWQVEGDSAEEVSVQFYEVTDPKLLVRFNLRRLPTVFFFRDGVPILYEGDLNADSLVHWTFANLEVRSWSLTDTNFDEETANTKDPDSSVEWLVHFCDVDAVGCDGFMATWESAASRLQGHSEIELGYVDVGTEVGLVMRFNLDLKKLPLVVLLKQGQAYWCTLPLNELTPETLVHFAKEGYLKTEEEDVPGELSALVTAYAIAKSNVKGIGIAMIVMSVVLFIIHILVRCRRVFSDVGDKKEV